MTFDADLLVDYANDLASGAHLVALPVARLHLEYSTREFPQRVTFYGAGMVETNKLGIVPNRENSKVLAEFCSHASGVTEETLYQHPLVVFPFKFAWDDFRKCNHQAHLEFIRKLSGHVDRACLNFIRYRQCQLFANGDPIHNLPARAGQLNDNHMMSGALLYNHGLREGRIIGGDAFTHIVTRGLGLSIGYIDAGDFPQDGEVGAIVSHALSLYTSLIESNNPTSFFVQAMSLLEFLAYPDEYQNFKEVKKIVAAYIAKDKRDYERLLERFFELTGKREEDSGRFIGYRTRIVHLGQQIEEILPDSEQRKNLFFELDRYIRAVVDHMIKHSAVDFDEYVRIRKTLSQYNP